MSKYIQNKYWTKSKTILFPLIYTKGTYKNIEIPNNTYCLFNLENEYYSIVDGYLTCIYNKENKLNVLNDEGNVVLIKNINEKEIAIVYKLDDSYFNTINKFLASEYSLINKTIKDKIYKFWAGYSPDDKYTQKPLDGILLDMILYPYKYYKEVSEELNIDINIIEKARELASKIDFSKEEILDI